MNILYIELGEMHYKAFDNQCTLWITKCNLHIKKQMLNANQVYLIVVYGCIT